MPKPSQKRKDGVPQPGAKKVSGASRNRRAGAGAEAEPVLPAGEWRNRIVGSGVEDAEQLLANPKNWRVHPKAQQDALCGVLKEIGWVQNVIVNQRTGYVIDGHARVALAITKGEQVPVVYVDLDENEEAIVLASLDPLAAMACTDKDLLAGVLADLKVSDADLAAMLANLGEMNGIEQIPAVGLTDDDAVPVLPVDPATVLGDVWLLGKHRVMCGDSTVSTDVDRLLDGVTPGLMVTDPPYGVEYDPAWRDEAAKYSPSMGNRKDTARGKVSNDGRADWREAWALFEGDIAYVWHAGKFAGIVQESLEACDFEIRSQIIWAKNHLAISRGHYHWQHEPCWYAVKKGGTGQWSGDRKQTTLWQIDKPQKSETGHGTQKPVECMRRPIVNNSSPGQAVYDPFCGSGSTLIACEKESRSCFAMELDPKYCDVIVKRWQEFTGKQATLEGDGRTFAEISSERMVTA